MKHHPLKRWRFEMQLTVREMAQKIGVSPGFVSLIEAGRRQPSLTIASRIAKVTKGKVGFADLSAGRR